MTSTTPGSDGTKNSTDVPDGSGTDTSHGDEEQDTTSGGAPEEPEK